MNAWRIEFGYLSRYIVAGGLNAVAGLGSTFLLLHLGASPTMSNIAGYAIGLTIAFFTARIFVFRSTAKKKRDGAKYLVSFLVSFGVNLLVLHACLDYTSIGNYMAQIVATASYVATMFLCSRFFVFSKRG